MHQEVYTSVEPWLLRAQSIFKATHSSSFRGRHLQQNGPTEGLYDTRNLGVTICNHILNIIIIMIFYNI